MSTAPVLDHHCHLDVDRGMGLDAVDRFVAAGGTHLIIINKPSWHLGPLPTDAAAFEAVFARTIAIVAAAAERLPGTAWGCLGVHPACISRLVDDGGLSAGAAAELMCAGLDRAVAHVGSDRIIGIKSGRPHYPVDAAVWDASNAVLQHALSLAAAAGCAIQLHTEAADALDEIAAVARSVGQPPERVVKHFAGGDFAGALTPSVISRRDALARACERGVPFLMETDFIDDPDRPGAVLGLRTVPRRVRWLTEAGHTDAMHTAHVALPARVYGIDTVATLS
jgi:Predicted metal-dependent hydrolase (urease superfamily)